MRGSAVSAFIVWLAMAVPAIGWSGSAALATEPMRQGEEIVVAQLSETPFFRRLFGLTPKEERPAGPRILKPDAAQPAAPSGGARTAPKRIQVAKPTPPPKDPDARRILVVGDQFAADLARGLEVAFADTPSVLIEPVTMSPSGLADPVPIDWQARIEAALGEDRPPGAVVVMLGLDDRIAIDQSGETLAFRSPSWEATYRKRVRQLASTIRLRQIPVYWMGLVPVGDLERTSDLAYLDEIYRQETTAVFATYVDIWNEFAGDTGEFVQSGPDVGGQVRQLRLADGVGFTRSGTRKLALYAEQAIRTWLSEGGSALALPPLAAAEGLVVSLNDPLAGPEEDLVATAAAAMPEEGSLLFDLLVLGRPLAPVAGRVDNAATVH